MKELKENIKEISGKESFLSKMIDNTDCPYCEFPGCIYRNVVTKPPFRSFTPCKAFYCTETCQLNDYSAHKDICNICHKTLEELTDMIESMQRSTADADTSNNMEQIFYDSFPSKIDFDSLSQITPNESRYGGMIEDNDYTYSEVACQSILNDQIKGCKYGLIHQRFSKWCKERDHQLYCLTQSVLHSKDIDSIVVTKVTYDYGDDKFLIKDESFQAKLNEIDAAVIEEIRAKLAAKPPHINGYTIHAMYLFGKWYVRYYPVDNPESQVLIDGSPKYYRNLINLGIEASSTSLYNREMLD